MLSVPLDILPDAYGPCLRRNTHRLPTVNASIDFYCDRFGTFQHRNVSTATCAIDYAAWDQPKRFSLAYLIPYAFNPPYVDDNDAIRIHLFPLLELEKGIPLDGTCMGVDAAIWLKCGIYTSLADSPQQAKLVCHTAPTAEIQCPTCHTVASVNDNPQSVIIIHLRLLLSVNSVESLSLLSIHVWCTSRQQVNPYSRSFPVKTKQTQRMTWGRVVDDIQRKADEAAAAGRKRPSWSGTEKLCREAGVDSKSTLGHGSILFDFLSFELEYQLANDHFHRFSEGFGNSFYLAVTEQLFSNRFRSQLQQQWKDRSLFHGRLASMADPINASKYNGVEKELLAMNADILTYTIFFNNQHESTLSNLFRLGGKDSPVRYADNTPSCSSTAIVTKDLHGARCSCLLKCP